MNDYTLALEGLLGAIKMEVNKNLSGVVLL